MSNDKSAGPANDNVIQFPGAASRPGKKSGRNLEKSGSEAASSGKQRVAEVGFVPPKPGALEIPVEQPGPDGLTETQRKAVALILSGIPFRLVGFITTPEGTGLAAMTHLTEQLSPDQQKALGTILGPDAFVCVGIRPTDRGADFVTSIHGDATHLRNAQTHLAGVIDRLYSRRGI